MERGRTDRPPREPPGSRRARRWHLLPPAVTPVGASDLAAGVAGHLRGTGRDRFRRTVESFLGGESSATYTSFRRALAACLGRLADRPGDGRRAVVVPSFCSSDFADAVEGVGLEPVKYDVDPGTLALDPGSLREALGEDTLAVVAVNVLGYSSDMAALAATCRAAGVPLLEAIGYAVGATYEGRRLGTFGDCAVLNFQQGKPIPVGGGMVVSHDPGLEFEDAGRPAVGPNVGLLAGYAALGRPRPYYLYRRLAARLEDAGLAGRATTHPEPKFDVEYAPPFATLSDFQGAVADRLFRRLDDHRRKRAVTARFYADALADCPGVELVTPVDGLSRVQYVRYPVRIHPESRRDRVQTALDGAGVQATALYDYPPIDADAFPGAARLQRTILTLPTHPYVDDGDRRRIVATVRRVCEADAWAADAGEGSDDDATSASDDATEPPDWSTTSHPGDDSTPAGTE